jgi:zinc transport system permease protein
VSVDWFSLSFALPCPVFGSAPGEWLEHVITECTGLFPDRTFFNLALNVRALIAIILVSICCGAVGSLVVGGRMAFFSDALAHCSFAGVSIGFLLFQGLVAPHRPGANFWEWVTPLMAAFGLLIGLGIVAVRQRTGLASDTVIGVFFSAAIGLAALLRKLINKRAFFSLEDFLFGNPLTATADDLLVLAGLTVVTLLFLVWGYNHLLLGSFNTSLALSRRVPLRLANFLFVALLAVIVNLCLRSVGALLINALLIVPAATAMNVSRNMRQLFWRTVVTCFLVCVTGQWLSWEMGIRTGVEVGISGTIVLLCVVLFMTSMVVGPLYRGRAIVSQNAAAGTDGG